MYHFFVNQEQIGEKEIKILGSDVNHIKKVLRMEIGEQFTVGNGEDQLVYLCKIQAFERDCIHLEILAAEESGAELPVEITLFQGLPKSGKMELIIQKAVELGAVRIVPMATKRAVVKLDQKKAQSRRKRWQTIAESAAKQSKRLRIPEITEVMSFTEAAALAETMNVKLIPYEFAKDMEETRRKIGAIRRGQSVAVFIGPEGGFAPEEITQAMESGIMPITLGKRILRTETAGMTVLSILMYCLE